MSKPVTQLAIVGLGRIAEVQLKALGHVPDLRLVAGADSNALRKAVLPPGTRFVTNSAELFAASDIDAVVVSTPLSSHYEVAATALSHGKHVLLEKPATQDTRQLGDLIGMARRKRLTLVVAFHAAFAKDLMWFRESRGAEIMERHGELRAIRCSFFDPHLNNGDAAQRFISYGGSWIDSGVNALSVVDRLIGVHTVHLTDAFLTRLSGYPGEIQATVHFTFPLRSGLGVGRGSIDTNWTLDDRKETHLYFEDPSVEVLLDHSKQTVELLRHKTERSVLADFSATGPRLLNQYVDVFRNFSACLAGERDNLEQATCIHHLLLAAAARTNS